jgi:CheY-like chemotaxis protein
MNGPLAAVHGDDSDGEEAIRRASADRPDVLVLDLMMPIKDGFDVIEAIRKDERLKDLAIVVNTALPPKSLPERERGLLSGVVAHITKPFDYKEFLAKVRKAVYGDNGNAPKTRTVVV